ncbi:hypothetical protein CCR94_06425 [Rhodoblastus sphagnicola]|uniref:Uncharacterized protein n=1 Tax=Rhodoblastus sphagnicola TaxID=333368 RepID=A0A2S6NCD7_9HYPH|nr:hypothetical protein CCR94_06425 [Rhodoblastus sphagnicola]
MRALGVLRVVRALFYFGARASDESARLRRCKRGGLEGAAKLAQVKRGATRPTESLRSARHEMISVASFASAVSALP